ncbi:uncharacterized protein LOC121378300 isoform X2 [Gigantopelta aegis]|uniref:uncharacterized protein LOC121378300 isoform X2 n=1 Tax=Gigantopelta aegis TaxID=1735272 RepID=UPI001B88CCEF|nr:uncharacterized protein LOC121378300 isoform X2 [Gigantopelta aegis]
MADKNSHFIDNLNTYAMAPKQRPVPPKKSKRLQLRCEKASRSPEATSSSSTSGYATGGNVETAAGNLAQQIKLQITAAIPEIAHAVANTLKNYGLTVNLQSKQNNPRPDEQLESFLLSTCPQDEVSSSDLGTRALVNLDCYLSW